MAPGHLPIIPGVDVDRAGDLVTVELSLLAAAALSEALGNLGSVVAIEVREQLHQVLPWGR